jgi:hypothetical protein
MAIKLKKKMVPNVMAEWLALLLHIWELHGSNCGQVINYPD